MSSRRILIVAPFPPRLAAEHGGALVIGRLAFELAADNDVGLLCFRGGDEAPVDDRLLERVAFADYVARPNRTSIRSRSTRAFGIVWGWACGAPRLVTNYRAPELERRLDAIVTAWQPTVVQFEFHLLAQFGSPPGPARIVVVHEPGADAAAATGGLLARVDAWAWRRFERRVFASADAVVVFSDEDRQAVERTAVSHVTRIPFGADLLELPPARPGPPTVLYYGNYSHAPNLAAADRLANAIFPRVRRRVPSARLALAGRAPEGARLPTGVGVEHLGFVADVPALLASATVVAAPVETGGGMRVKVAESLAAGKAVVASRRAMAGIAATAGTHYAAAESDDEFATAISRLLESDDEREAMERAAKQFASTELRWGDVARSYDTLYLQLGAPADAAATSATVPPGDPGLAARPPRDE